MKAAPPCRVTAACASPFHREAGNRATAMVARQNLMRAVAAGVPSWSVPL
jgi:hypothetical protein